MALLTHLMIDSVFTRAMEITWSYISHHQKGYHRPTHVMVGSALPKQQDKPQSANTFQDSACIIFAKNPLAKARHMANPHLIKVAFCKIYLFMLNWVFTTGFSLVAESKDHSLVAMCRLLTAMASLVVEHRLQGMQTLAVAAHGLSSCSSQALEQGFSNCSTWAQLFHGMWDTPGPGIESASPALAGGFFTTEPPGKPKSCIVKDLHTGRRVFLQSTRGTTEEKWRVKLSLFQVPYRNPCVLCQQVMSNSL